MVTLENEGDVMVENVWLRDEEKARALGSNQRRISSAENSSARSDLFRDRSNPSGDEFVIKCKLQFFWRNSLTRWTKPQGFQCFCTGIQQKLHLVRKRKIHVTKSNSSKQVNQIL
jgi:hypothetical protein